MSLVRNVRIVKHERSGAVIASRARVATSLLHRLKGLLGTTSLSPGEGLIIEPCTSVHMLFMRFPIDVLFCNGEGRIVRICSGLKPWQFSPIVLDANYVIELPAGTARDFDINLGDTLLLTNSVNAVGLTS